MNPTILTASGHYFHLLEPEACEIHIRDIAHALSHICRFTGHVQTFYSVAEHCYHASYLVPAEHALQALMHDAAEAYLGDVSSPLKQLLPQYKAIEARVEAAIFARLNLPAIPHPCIKHADLVMLATERRDLMLHQGGETWTLLDGIEAMPMIITPMAPEQARHKFTNRFVDLWADHILQPANSTEAA